MRVLRRWWKTCRWRSWTSTFWQRISKASVNQNGNKRPKKPCILQSARASIQWERRIEKTLTHRTLNLKGRFGPSSTAACFVFVIRRSYLSVLRVWTDSLPLENVFVSANPFTSLPVPESDSNLNRTSVTETHLPIGLQVTMLEIQTGFASHLLLSQFGWMRIIVTSIRPQATLKTCYCTELSATLGGQHVVLWTWMQLTEHLPIEQDLESSRQIYLLFEWTQKHLQRAETWTGTWTRRTGSAVRDDIRIMAFSAKNLVSICIHSSLSKPKSLFDI